MTTAYNITLSTTESLNLDFSNNQVYSVGVLSYFLDAFQMGDKRGTLSVQDNSTNTAASGTLTISSGSGTVGGVINRSYHYRYMGHL